MRQRALCYVFFLVVMSLAASACKAAQPDKGATGFQSSVASKVVPWTAIPAAKPEAIRFAVIGDRTGSARPGVFEQALVQLDWMKPEFIMTIGDLVEGYSDDRQILEKEWLDFEKAVDKIKVPLFYVPGNHDLGTNMQLTLWNERRGAPWYWFSYKGALFLILNTEDPPAPMSAEATAAFRKSAAGMVTDPDKTEAELAQFFARQRTEPKDNANPDPVSRARFSAAQMQWVKQTLDAHRDARWTFVFLHKPAWMLDSAEFAEIERALGTRPYTVFAGHHHYYRHQRRHGRDYLDVGPSGGIFQQPGKGAMDHITWVTLDEGEPSIALVKLSGILNLEGESGQTRAR